MILLSDIKRLLSNSESIFKELERNYSFIPPTKCKRMAFCCSLMPEVTLVECLVIFKWLITVPLDVRMKILQRMVYYFFMNPVEIIKCPFLEGKDCLIYDKRFFGCRAYGLWSKEYYEKLSEKSCYAKNFIRKQWEVLGISLPSVVMDFYVPYCLNVKINSHKFKIDDQFLLKISDNINTLSQYFGKWHEVFKQIYFSDSSFLLASLLYGFPESVRLKFDIVNDFVKTGSREKLNEALKEVKSL